MSFISVRIDLSKIDDNHVYKGEKGDYLDVTLMENRDGPDQYGNHYMVVQGVSKEARLRKERGPILGNAKIIETSGGGKPQRGPSYANDRQPEQRGPAARPAPPARYGAQPEPEVDPSDIAF